MIEVIPELIEVGGRRVVKVTVREADGTILDADVVNPLDSVKRRKVAQRLAERAGDAHSAERIEQALLQCVDLMGKADQPREEDGEAVHVGNVRVVRPELFITPEVVAVAVPEVVIRGGQAVGRWRLYLRYSQGAEDRSQKSEDRSPRGVDRRESAELSASVELPGGEKLWVHPRPAEPGVQVAAGWSDESRQRWLAGSASPRPSGVFAKLVAAFEEYLDFPPEDAPESAATLALWTMLTYCFPAWDAVPYLYVSGPAGSGKTRVFELLSRLVFRPIGSSNLSAPALFRTLHDRGGTLLLDEAERLKEGSPEVAELRSILLAGYKRGGKATRLESTGDGFAMAEFQVFGPKAIACIEGLPGPLLSRCIALRMFRSPPESAKPRHRLDQRPSRWMELRDELHELLLGALGKCAPALSSLSEVCSLGGRNYELWQPILALAEWVEVDGEAGGRAGGATNGGLRERLEAYAKKLTGTNQEEQVPEEDQTVLRVLAEQVRQDRTPTPKEVLWKAQQVDAEMFRRWSARKVSDVLRRYGIESSRYGGKRLYRSVTVAHLKKIEASYGIDLEVERSGSGVQVRMY